MAYNSINDWNMFINYSRTQGATVFGSYASSAVASTFEAYSTKSLSQYGTSLQIGATYDTATNQPTIGAIALPDSNTYGLKVQLTQPILKNAFGRADQYPLKLKTKLDDVAKIVDTNATPKSTEGYPSRCIVLILLSPIKSNKIIIILTILGFLIKNSIMLFI